MVMEIEEDPEKIRVKLIEAAREAKDEIIILTHWGSIQQSVLPDILRVSP